MKVLIFGSGGQLGREAIKQFPTAVGYDHADGSTRYLDITRREVVARAIHENSPDVVMNCAAMTNVDRCESLRKEAYAANSEAVKHMVEASRSIGAYFVHFSTDYVFDGKTGGYREDDIPNPVNFYGLSKLLGDAYVASYRTALTIRTSGVYGRGSNFPLFTLNRLSKGEKVDALAGYYSPIHANLLARATKQLVEDRATGIINIAGDAVSRLQLAVGIAEEFGLNEKLVKEVYHIPSFTATRPYDSSLSIEEAKGRINFDFHSMTANIDALRNGLNTR